MNGKRILNLVPTLVLLPTIVAGQATFTFSNRPGYGVNAPVFDAQGVPLQGPRYVATLYGGINAGSLAPAWMFSMGRSGLGLPVPFGTGRSAGYFGFLVSSDVAEVPSVPGNGWAWLQVRAWDTTLGSTYEEVVARGLGGYGESNIFQSRGGCQSCGGAPHVPGNLTGLQSFRLLPVIPEPCTCALMALGGAGLWLAARRQRRSGRSSGKAQNGGPGRC